MELTYFSLAIFGGSLLAGCLGALTGLGGGVVIIPLLVLVFHTDLRYAIGASLVAVIATSTGSAAAYIREGYTNVRVAMLLEVATTIGAIVGALIAGMTNKLIIMYIFIAVLFWSAISSLRETKHAGPQEAADPLAVKLRLNSTYPSKDGPVPYGVQKIPAGLLVMFGAGVLSALVGVGSGVVKVIAMDRLMRLPFKVSTTTSNFMIGVTAAASAGVYFHRGQLDPALCGPVALGAMAGSWLGTKVLVRAKTRALRIIFAIVVAGMGVQLLIRALTGKI
ncbi:MAG TPA: sulfite exporter TauE/SafE family protein [Phycisphaerales bacterium]|nr:sulfite exporter TauE/SafE family protein [Phycisphaerales bacterium]